MLPATKVGGHLKRVQSAESIHKPALRFQIPAKSHDPLQFRASAIQAKDLPISPRRWVTDH